MFPAGVQPSLTVTPLRILGTAAWQVPSALALGMAEQVTVGGVVSLTVKTVEQVALLPAASVAVTVMVCAPRPTRVSAAGDWVIVMLPAGVQPSLTVTPLRILGTAAWQVPSAPALGMAEQVTVGGVVSVTVKTVEQVALLPAASVAVTVIVCAPRPTRVPAAGDWTRVIDPAPVQPSVTVTPGRTL